MKFVLLMPKAEWMTLCIIIIAQCNTYLHLHNNTVKYYGKYHRLAMTG